MSDIDDFMKRVEEMETQVMQERKKLSKIDVCGVSGAGLVKVTMNCQHVIKEIKIDPSIVISDEVIILEDLIVAAMNDAFGKAQNEIQGLYGAFLPEALSFLPHL